MNPKVILVWSPTVVLGLLGSWLAVPFTLAQIVSIGVPLLVVTLLLFTGAHLITKSIVGESGPQREANEIVRKLFMRGIAGRVYVVLAAGLVVYSYFYVQFSPSGWFLLVVGASLSASLDFANDFRIWLRERKT